MTHPEALTESVLLEWEFAADNAEAGFSSGRAFVRVAQTDPFAAVGAIGDLAAEVRRLRASLAVAIGAMERLRSTIDAGPVENGWIDRIVTEALATIGGAR